MPGTSSYLPKYFILVAEELYDTLKIVLADVLTEELEDAWKEFIAEIHFGMIE